jgi:DNA-binding FrmR family transcriptional regulator
MVKKDDQYKGVHHAQQQQQLLVRLKTIAGHIRGIQRMVEADAYCIDMIKQTQAIQRALDKWSSLLLESHLTNCVTEAIRSDQQQERERVLTELLEVFQPVRGSAQVGAEAPLGPKQQAQRVATLQQIEAQVRDLQQQLEANSYCIDLIREAQAIRRAFDSFNHALLAGHLNSCVVTAIRSEQPAEREQMVEELLQVFDTTSSL